MPFSFLFVKWLRKLSRFKTKNWYGPIDWAQDSGDLGSISDSLPQTSSVALCKLLDLSMLFFPLSCFIIHIYLANSSWHGDSLLLMCTCSIKCNVSLISAGASGCYYNREHEYPPLLLRSGGNHGCKHLSSWLT